MEKDLTKGSVLKTVLEFSLPYLLSYFLQTLYGMADLFIIGQYNGVESITAVSVGSPDSWSVFRGRADSDSDIYACRSGTGSGHLSQNLFCRDTFYNSV